MSQTCRRVLQTDVKHFSYLSSLNCSNNDIMVIAIIISTNHPMAADLGEMIDDRLMTDLQCT